MPETYSTNITEYSQVQVTAGFPNYPDGTYHGGGDIVTPHNADRNVRSIISGVVIRSEYGSGGTAAYGNFITVYDSVQNITWLTAHYYSRGVKVGDTVTVGDFLGVYGATGNAFGMHVHNEILLGRGFETGARIDPFPYIGVPNNVGIYDVTHDQPLPPVPPSPPTFNSKLPLYYYLRRF